MAFRTRDVHIRQELDVEADLPRAVTRRAAQSARIIGKIPRLAAVFLCVGRSRIYLAQLVMHIGVSRNGRTDVDADRRCVDQLDLFDPLGLDRKDMRRQTGPRNMRLQPGHKAFQNLRRLARAGHAGHDREPALRNFRLQRLYRMDSRRGQADFSRCKHRSGTFLPPGNHRRGGEERPDLRIRTCPNVLHGPLRDYAPAAGAGLRPQLNDPVGLLEHLRVMVHKQNRIAVRNEVAHHAAESLQIRGVQPDRRFVQHIQHARRAVADRACELHPLPFAGRQRGRGAVKRQISQAQLHQPLRRRLKGFADALRHRAHLPGQPRGKPPYPFRERRQIHFANLVQRKAEQLRPTRRFGQAGTAAVGADVLLEKFFHALHTLFVLYLGKRVFHGINGVIIGKIQFSRLIGIFRFI